MTGFRVRVAAGRHARIFTLAATLGFFVAGCESKQIAAPVPFGVQWTRITDPATTPLPYYPDWRGNSIVFEFGTLSLRLAVVPEDGSAPPQFLPGLSGTQDRGAHWVNDSTIVFTSNRSGGYDLWYRTLSGATLRRLTAFVGNEWDPDPRPGAPGLVYVEGQHYHGRLTLIPDSAGVPLEIRYLTPATLKVGEPNWDPAGQRVCFSADSADAYRHIWLVSLTPGDTLAVQLTTGPFIDSGPRFSPDGSRIAFASNRTGRSGVWTVSPAGEGSGLDVVAFNDQGTVLDTPAWSPDGTRIAVTSGKQALQYALWILSDLP